MVFYQELAGSDKKPAIVGRLPGMDVRFAPNAVHLRLPGHSLTIHFLDTGEHSSLEGTSSPARVNIFHGGKPATWRTSLTALDSVRYRDLYPGIDAVYRSSEAGLKADYIVRPGANPGRIHFRCEGAVVSLEEDGSLLFSMGGDSAREEAPQIYQLVNGRRQAVRGAYLLHSDGSIGFQLGKYDRSHTLVIDPSVKFSTFWGGSLFDALTGVAVGADGSIYVCGWTESADVFTSAGAFQGALKSSTDAFVMKLKPDHSIAYATYLGGGGVDRANGIAVDPAGDAYIAGSSSSPDFPTRAALQTSLRGGRNAFVAELSPTGAALVYSTYLGGSGLDQINAIQVDSVGAVYLAGQTTSLNFPTANAYQSVNRGGQDAFVAKLNPLGISLAYSTYLGGGNTEAALGLAVLNGESYVTGATDSVDFPTLNPIQGANQGGQDAFVAKLNSAGSGLVYSTYIGGSSGGPTQPEMGMAIAVDSAGEAVVAGVTSSGNFPTVGALQPFLAGESDAFVSKLNSSGSSLIFSTFLGGTSFDSATAVAVDWRGSAYVAGFTSSTDFPTISPLQGTLTGSYDGFTAVLTPSGNALTFSTYWGGSGSDSALALARFGNGSLYSTGQTLSYNYPLVAPLDNVNRGNFDGFITEISGLNIEYPYNKIGVFRGAGVWILDIDGNGAWDSPPDQAFSFGLPGDVPVMGDWDGSGTLKFGVYRNGLWYVDYNGSKQWDAGDRVFAFGLPGDVPVVGDWDGSGKLKLGVYRNGLWFVDYAGCNCNDPASYRVFSFGLPGDIPVVGDWDGSGKLKLGVFRNGLWFVDYAGCNCYDPLTYRVFFFGLPGDLPVIGDWGNTGRLKLGVYRNGYWYVDYNGNNMWDAGDRVWSFGYPGDRAVTGPW